MAVSQLYVMRTPQSESLILQSIDTRLIAIQQSMATHTRADDVTTAQVVMLYAIMRIYRSSSIALESIDRIPLRLMQHVVSKSMYCLQPHTNVSPSDWEDWIIDEGLRRCFFILHALDYVSNARQSVPTALCSLFSHAPLPCPSHVWDAPTTEEWAARHRVWEEFCSDSGSGSGSGSHSKALRAGDLIRWLRGEESG
ncbi:hypothetical protein C7999DRAFT_35274 [Corynascus novoguineensis]|uniref:Transcription factor domain-containing protein n=1 Tax=Corynascus novoguineensis TaxID=1126955 RepID=A0AAN7CLP7_9PEZI|nr:hypothetical protein C7999DRAFT_35274 [Corynascus novoguineensis]